MDDEGKCIHFFLIYKDIQFHKLGALIAFHLIIKGSIASGAGFQCVEEVVNDLVQGQGVSQEGAGGFHVLHSLVDATALLAKVHDCSDVLAGHHDLSRHHGLLHVLDLGGVREVGGVGEFDHVAVGLVDFIDYARSCGHDIEIVLSLQTLLDDLQMKQS